MIALPIACSITGNRLIDGGTLLPDLAVAGVGLSLGPELLSNGGFLTDTVWVKGLSWTIAANAATVLTPVATSLLSQALALTPGAMYRVQYTVTAYTSGALFVRFTNAGANVTTISSASGLGTVTAMGRLTGAADSLSFVAPNSLAAYSISNVSLRLVV